MPRSFLGGGGKNRVFAYNNPVFEEGKLQRSLPEPQHGTTVLTIETVEGVAVDPVDEFNEALYPSTNNELFRRLTWEFWGVQVAVLLFVFTLAYTDPIQTDNRLIIVVLLCVQLALVLMVLMAFFLLTSQTIFIQLGRYDRYMREFGYVYYVGLLELVVLAALRTYNVVLIYDNAGYTQLWQLPGYYALWVAQRLVVVAFWMVTAASAFFLFQDRYYDPRWLATAK